MGAIESATALREAALAGRSTDALRPLTQAWFDDLSGLRPDDELAGRSMVIVASGIPSAGAAATTYLANACGTLVENGWDSGPLAGPLLERLTVVARRAGDLSRSLLGSEPVSDDVDPGELVAERVAALDESSPAVDDWNLLAGLLAPAVAVLVTDARSGIMTTELAGLLEPIEALHPSAHWILRALRVLHNEPFVAIELSSRIGIAGTFSGISENFQLNALLMDVFPKGGFLSKPRISAKAAAIARGDGPQVGEETVIGSWNLYTWKAVAGKRTPPDKNDTTRTDDWIWNEGIPADIPLFEGRRVILLGPPSYERSWHAQRDFATLRATIDAVRMSKQDVGDLVERISDAARPA
jgi:hypothetical protein